MYTKTSLNYLKAKTVLHEVLKDFLIPHPKMHLLSYKCPFHQDESLSLEASKKGTHYRCTGCIAEGDSITFLMTHGKMSYTSAVEYLAKKFNVKLEYELRVNPPVQFGASLSQPEIAPPPKKAWTINDEEIPF